MKQVNAKPCPVEWEQGGGNTPMIMEKDMSRTIVRRLTPLECERLQGFPDEFTNIGEWVDLKGKKRKDSDSNRYKALGNSIAIPQFFWVFKKMSKHINENATLGSLFDGIGGFPLAWEEVHGKGTAKWASEIEDFPIRVTEKHFPTMKHLGDITKIDGSKIEPVDCISFGSPCQDLSVAGKRAGLEGERSGLFMEAVRIAKEMRKEDIKNGRTGSDIRPRFLLWENVPGALSSNKNEDFRVVLEELCRIREADITIPRPDKKWSKSGFIAGDDWSIAWRQMDAQYWGVQQRRKRIALVMDLAGRCSGEILFESTSVHRDFEQSIEAWKGIAKDPGGCTEGSCTERRTESSSTLQIRGGAKEEARDL